VACVGGGSNAAGTYYHFLDHEDVNIAVEAAGLEQIPAKVPQHQR
jgi:tryptophan synthase beta chain